MPKPPVSDGRRSCMRADGTPKKCYPTRDAAAEFIVQQHGGLSGHYAPYSCYNCDKWHVGGKNRRMIFPDAEHPCGTPNCKIDVAHYLTECGTGTHGETNKAARGVIHLHGEEPRFI